MLVVAVARPNSISFGIARSKEKFEWLNVPFLGTFIRWGLPAVEVWRDQQSTLASVPLLPELNAWREHVFAGHTVHWSEVPATDAGVDVNMGLLLMGAFIGGATLFCGGGGGGAAAAAAAGWLEADPENENATLDATGDDWLLPFSFGWNDIWGFAGVVFELPKENTFVEDGACVDWAKTKGWLLLFPLGWNGIDGVGSVGLTPAKENPLADDVVVNGAGAGSEREIS
jgi:hypothetical protein